MSWTLERIQKKMAEINASIPPNLQKNVAREVKKTPVVEMVMLKALEDPNFPEEKKAAIRTLLDAGDFSKTKIVEDAKIAKQIDNYIGRKINEAIKKGELPSKAQLKKLPEFNQLFK